MMNQYFNIYKIVGFFLFMCAISSCKKFVQISPPVTKQVSDNVFNNSSSATAAQTNIYVQMQQNTESYNMALNNGLLSDELTNYSSLPYVEEFYSNAMQAINNYGPWNDAYNYIYQSNAIISGLQANTGISATIKQQLTGESLFTRAFWHFYLANCYGDVPLVTSSVYTVNATLARTPRNQVYQQVITDLNNAENLLNTNYVDATDTSVTTERVRPTKWAAAALLARAYLYTGSYDSAEIQANLVINNTELYTLCSLDSVFLMNSTETIWQLQTPQPYGNTATADGVNFILSGIPLTIGSQNCTTLSPQLVNSFDSGDLRKADWVNAYTPDSINYYYYPFKYKDNNSTSPSEYVMMLRLGEQYLIRSEAEVEIGNTGGAVADLNIIRNRAGLANYSGPTDKNSLLAAILHERQVELFTEWGNRWFDLNRTAAVDSVMSVVTPLKGGGAWTANDQLYPIPFTELQNDPKLTQNSGY